MVRRHGQLSIEFVAATMIFIFAAVLVVSALFRSYALLSDSRQETILHTKLEVISESLTGSSFNGFAGDGVLDYPLLASIPAGNYSALRDIARFREDYRIELYLLPSLIIRTYLDNPISGGSGRNITTFETFVNSTPLNLTVVPVSMDGSPQTAARTIALLVNQSDSLVDMKEANSAGKVSLVPTYEGIYTIRLVAYDGAKGLFGTKDLTVGVVAT